MLTGACNPMACPIHVFRYTRVAVPIEELEVLLRWARLPANARIWMYVPNGRDATQTPGIGLQGPSFRCPILQTYVDVCITGCLEVSEEYAIEFITSTSGWDGAWLNDRACTFADGWAVWDAPFSTGHVAAV